MCVCVCVCVCVRERERERERELIVPIAVLFLEHMYTRKFVFFADCIQLLHHRLLLNLNSALHLFIRIRFAC